MKRDALKALLTALLVFGAAGLAQADGISYRGIGDVQATAGGVTCRHHHDWSRDDKARFDMITGKTELFSAANTYAWVSCSKGDAQLFKSPAPALTMLVMSDDGRFVVGVSNIKLWNPVQIAIWETGSGTRLFAAKVESRDACFSVNDYAKFLAEHPVMRAALAGGAILVDGVVHANIVYREPDEAALRELVARQCPSYIARNISESVTNWVSFYAEPSGGPDAPAITDPHFRIENGSDGKPAFLDFLDIKGVPARVDLHPHYVEPAAPLDY